MSHPELYFEITEAWTALNGNSNNFTATKTEKTGKIKNSNDQNKNFQTLTENEKSKDPEIPTRIGVNGWSMYGQPGSFSSSFSSVVLRSSDVYVHNNRGGDEVEEGGRGGVRGRDNADEGGYRPLFPGMLSSS